MVLVAVGVVVALVAGVLVLGAGGGGRSGQEAAPVSGMTPQEASRLADELRSRLADTPLAEIVTGVPGPGDSLEATLVAQATGAGLAPWETSPVTVKVISDPSVPAGYVMLDMSGLLEGALESGDPDAAFFTAFFGTGRIEAVTVGDRSWVKGLQWAEPDGTGPGAGEDLWVPAHSTGDGTEMSVDLGIDSGTVGEWLRTLISTLENPVVDGPVLETGIGWVVQVSGTATVPDLFADAGVSYSTSTGHTGDDTGWSSGDDTGWWSSEDSGDAGDPGGDGTGTATDPTTRLEVRLLITSGARLVGVRYTAPDEEGTSTTVTLLPLVVPARTPVTAPPAEQVRDIPGE